MADDPPVSVPPEPFGQLGVRQFSGRVIAWFCIILTAFSLVMSQRSSIFDDELHWQSGDQVISIRSTFGRIFVEGHNVDAPRRHGSGWSYSSRVSRNPRDGWQPSVWKVIGIEFNSDPFPGNATGFWLRIKWSFIAMLFMIQPLWRISLALVRRWNYRIR